MEDELILLTVVSNELEAELACELLRSEGIPTMYRLSNFAFGAGGEFPMSGAGPREILVHRSRFDDAREMIDGLAEADS